MMEFHAEIEMQEQKVGRGIKKGAGEVAVYLFGIFGYFRQKHEKPPQAVGLQGFVLLYSFGCQTPLFYFLIKIAIDVGRTLEIQPCLWVFQFGVCLRIVENVHRLGRSNLIFLRQHDNEVSCCAFVHIINLAHICRSNLMAFSVIKFHDKAPPYRWQYPDIASTMSSKLWV